MKKIIATIVIGLVLALVLSFFLKTESQRSCYATLRLIEGAKDEWAKENKAKDGMTPSGTDILKMLPQYKTMPKCPQGGTYTIGAIGSPPKCSLPRHNFP